MAASSDFIGDFVGMSHRYPSLGASASAKPHNGPFLGVPAPEEIGAMLNRAPYVSVLMVLLASCANSSPDPGASTTAAAGIDHRLDSGYVLSPQELKLSCRKLTGRMQVRILQIRDHEQRARASAASRWAQQAAMSLYGGSRHGVNPDAEYRRDRAVLEAYNRQLAAKRCKTFDLEAELTPKHVRETPIPAHD
jgi:hypothetical protein